jgi:hypothetical protein
LPISHTLSARVSAFNKIAHSLNAPQHPRANNVPLRGVQEASKNRAVALRGAAADCIYSQESLPPVDNPWIIRRDAPISTGRKVFTPVTNRRHSAKLKSEQIKTALVSPSITIRERPMRPNVTRASPSESFVSDF